jgi:TonB family protein
MKVLANSKTLVGFCLLTIVIQCSTTVFAQNAQTDLAIPQVASNSANQIDKRHPKVVLSGPLRNCLRKNALCLQLEAALHDALQRTETKTYFLTRDEVEGALAKRGFLGIDAYDGEVLRLIASDLHSDLLLTEDLLWNPQITGIATELIDVSKGKLIARYTAQFATPDSSSDEPVLVKDEQSGASLVVFPFSKGKYLIQIPTSYSCPSPSNSVEIPKVTYQGVVRLVGTITAEGKAEQMIVVTRVKAAVSDSAIKTVRQWCFHPAIGENGQPFPVRMPIEVTFHHP